MMAKTVLFSSIFTNRSQINFGLFLLYNIIFSIKVIKQLNKNTEKMIIKFIKNL